MWKIHGHESALRQLETGLKEGRLAHAYLLVGPAQVGKRTLAVNLAQAVNCLSPDVAPCGDCPQCRRIAASLHPDVLVIGIRKGEDGGPARREIGIGNVREVQRQANLKPYEGSCRVFIFDGAEYMSEEASNSLLKTLEEPPPQVLIVLLTTAEEALLPTIRSRCRRLEMRPLPLTAVADELMNTHSLASEKAGHLARLSMGCLGWALSALGDPALMESREEELEHITQLPSATLADRFNYAAELSSLIFRNRERGREVLQLWLRWWRDLLIVKEGAGEFVHNIDKAEALSLRASRFTTAQVREFIEAIMGTFDALEHNANPRLALEVLMLKLPAESPVP